MDDKKLAEAQDLVDWGAGPQYTLTRTTVVPSPTLDELEGEDWGEPVFDSHLVVTCHRLRKKPVDEFTFEDLRLMIGQKISLLHLLPRAVAVLEANPLADGDFYPGDLLESVLRTFRSFLREQPDLLRRILAVTDQAEKLIAIENEASPCEANESVLSQIREFRTLATAK
jgi:hypothetical protein